MSNNRFFIPQEVFDGEETIFPQDISRQINSVLRLKKGDQVIILDNRGHNRPVTLNDVTPKKVTGKPGEIASAGGEPAFELILCPALTGRDKFEWILQKGTELGVKRFIPLITTRTLIQEADGLAAKLARWQKIVQEAAEQSGRGLIPEVNMPEKLSGLLKRNDIPRGFILYEKERQSSLAETWQQKFNTGVRSIALLIGPEGGFTEAEAKQAEESGFTPVTVGQRILRMETAALAACVICMNEAGEMG